MKRSYAILGIALMIGLAFSGAAAADAASVQTEGKCTDDQSNEGQDGEDDSSSVSVGQDGPSHDGPDHLEENLNACANGASNGETPDGGSYTAVHASALEDGDGDSTVSASANTVAVSDLVTGVDESTSASAQTAGACRDNAGNGGEDTGGVGIGSDASVNSDGVDENAVASALTACATNGDLPGGGSYFRASITALEDDDGDTALTVSFDTVPLTDQITPVQ